MKKPIPLTNITIQAPQQLTPEQAQRVIRDIRAKSEKEVRDYEIYEKGLRDGRRGLFGLFGF